MDGLHAHVSERVEGNDFEGNTFESVVRHAIVVWNAWLRGLRFNAQGRVRHASDEGCVA